MTLTTIGIVGAGTMGRRIAYSCIAHGKRTRLYDTSASARSQAIGAVQQLVADRVAAGTLSSAVLDAVVTQLSMEFSLAACVEDVDLVIETVPEKLDLKRQVFAEIDRLAPPETLIGTNSSSIPGSWLADATCRPERVFNLNFGTTDDLKVEIMGHGLTAPATLKVAEAFVWQIGLVPILVRGEIMGYVGNRVWRAVKKEVLFLLDRGYSTPEDIDRGWMLDWKTPLGPCGLMDRIGLDVVRDIEEMYHRASGDPSDRPPKLLEDMVAQGKLGLKSREGFYQYPNPAYERQRWLNRTGEPVEE